MHFPSTPEPHDLTPEQRLWVDRFIATIPHLEAMESSTRESFDQLTDHILKDRFGELPVVAHVLEHGGPSVEVLPFLVPILEELHGLIADGCLVETEDAWVLITDDAPTSEEADDDDIVEMDAETLGLTDPSMTLRFDLVMMELRALAPDHRTRIVNLVFDIIEANFMDHPGIASYYDSGEPNSDAAFIIVPIFEAALACNRTFQN